MAGLPVEALEVEETAFEVVTRQLSGLTPASETGVSPSKMRVVHLLYQAYGDQAQH